MAEPRVPKPLQPFYGDYCKHSSEKFDFQSVAGKDIGVIGISASAVDNAASALESGASNVFLFVRSPTIPRINKMKSAGYPGFTHGFPTEWLSGNVGKQNQQYGNDQHVQNRKRIDA